MKQTKVLILIGVVTLLLAAFFAFDDHLSELSPLFLVLGLGSFGWLIYQKSWRLESDKSVNNSIAPSSWISKLSGILGVTGLLSLGLSALSFFDTALAELAPLGLIGVLLLVFALLARIVNGIILKRVDATTGGLSIAVILGLLGVLGIVCLAIYVVFLWLSGLAIL